MARLLGRLVMWLMGGWVSTGIKPHAPCVIAGGPHTSNWDFVISMAWQFAEGHRFHWIGKHTLFKPPFGWILRSLNGRPVNRNAPGGLIGQVTEQFQRGDIKVLALSPEGTRKYTDGWKSGFYRIAKAANLPIQVALLDYKNKRIGLGGVVTLTDDPEYDLQQIAKLFEGIEGKYPERQAPIRFLTSPNASRKQQCVTTPEHGRF